MVCATEILAYPKNYIYYMLLIYNMSLSSRIFYVLLLYHMIIVTMNCDCDICDLIYDYYN